jgi:hypothetical protein
VSDDRRWGPLQSNAIVYDIAAGSAQLAPWRVVVGM